MKKFYFILATIAVMMMFIGCPDAVNGENEGKNNGVAGNVSVPSYTIIFFCQWRIWNDVKYGMQDWSIL